MDAMPRSPASCVATALVVVASLGPLFAQAQALPPLPWTSLDPGLQNQQRLQQQNQQRNEQAYSAGPRPPAFGGGEELSWNHLPALLPAGNRLLGRWRPTQRKADFANITGNGALAGLAGRLGAVVAQGDCYEIFGRGLVELGTTSMAVFGQRGGQGAARQVIYRGSGRQVAVVSRDSGSQAQLNMLFDGADRAIVVGRGCALERVGEAGVATMQTNQSRTIGTAQPTAPSLVPVAVPTPAMAAPSPRPDSVHPTAAGGSAVLSLAAGILVQPGRVSPPSNNLVVVLRDSAETALARRGYQPPPGMSPLQGWSAACQAGAPACGEGAAAIEASGVGSIRTDANGRAQVPGIRPGTYYLFALARYGDQRAIWNVRVDLQPGANPVTLDQRNAVHVD